MTPTFDTLLSPLLAHLRDVGFGTSSADALYAAARELPPIWRGGFEVHLDRPLAACRLDLHQAVVSNHDEPRRLAQFLRSQPKPGSGWASLEDLATWWHEAGQNGRPVLDTMWIEVDTDQEPLEPSMFLTLAHNGQALTADGESVALEVAHLFPDKPYESCVRRSLDAAAVADATVTHLGFMLGRENQTLRVNIKPRATLDGLSALLDAIDWPGDAASSRALCARLAPLADSVVMAFDFAGHELAPRVGFELFIHGIGETHPRWAALLDALVAETLCTPEYRSALLQSGSLLTPPTLSTPWPDPLMVESLLDPQARFSALQVHLHHIKATWSPEATVAKGYLRFDHQWLDAPTAKTSPALDAAQAAAKAIPTRDGATFRREAQTYYDEATSDYLDSLGPTFQAYLLRTADGEDPQDSNVILARRAGIKPGMRVLDLGCGVGGPALDIAAAISDVAIDGITISHVQATTARERIEAAGLAKRVRVTQGDYHEIPFSDEVFDLAYIFEAVGYSSEPARLFEQVLRVLRPGGLLYIKDLFVPDRPLTDSEAKDLAVFDRIYAQTSPTASSIRQSLSDAGFVVSDVSDLSALSGGEHWQRAHQGTALGTRHNAPMPHLPIYVAEIRAVKPAT